MKIIIAKQSYHREIRNFLLQNQACAMAEVLTMDNFLDKSLFGYKDDSLYRYFDVLKKAELSYFKESINKSSFLRELKDFIYKMKMFNIDTDSLIDDDDYLKELKQIITLVFPIKLKIDYQLQVIDQLTKLEDVYIVDQNPTFFEQQMYQKLIDKGAIWYQKEPVSIQDKKYYNYLNKRCEVEGLARYLIKKDIDLPQAKITLLDTSYQPFIKQIFKRYNIPYHFVCDMKTPRIVYKYIALIKYYLNASKDNLLNLIKEEVFANLGEKANNAFYNYTRLFEYDLNDDYEHIANAKISKDILNTYELDDLKSLEKDANDFKNEIKPDLDYLLRQATIIQAIAKIDDIILKYNDVDIKVLYQMRDKVIKAQKYLNEENISILYEDLKSITINQANNPVGISILGASDCCLGKKYHFVLGASNDNFPGFKGDSGIFSETYLEQIKYPKLVDRYALFLNNALDNLNSEFLYVSKSIASFDGKEKKSALEMDDFIKIEAQYVDIQFAKKVEQPIGNEKIADHIAEALFFNNHMIKGSVSSLEKYSNCPFSYFLDKGLGLKEKTKYEYSSAKNGTLIHYILEQLVNDYQDEFAKVDMIKVDQMIEEKLAEITTIYPNLHKSFQLVSKRLSQLIKVNLQYLATLDQYSKLTSFKQEYEFNEIVNVNNIQLNLKGFIDRIKQNDDFIQIIDYKSSKKKLSEAKFLQGQQLQLLTYAIVLKKLYPNKHILGAYYYNFKMNSIRGSYAKRKRKEVIENNEEIYLEQLQKEHKYSGWTFEPYYELIGGDHNCVEGISVNKDGSLSAKSHIYDLSIIEQALMQIYKMIITNIQKGDIAIKPTDCQYCCYKNICHYPASGDEEKPSIELEEDLYRKDLNI